MEKDLQEKNNDRELTPREKRLCMQELCLKAGIPSVINDSLQGQTSITFVHSAPKLASDEAESHFRYLNRKKDS